MRKVLGSMCAIVFLAGCKHPNADANAHVTTPAPVSPKTYVTPHLGISGRVEMVNDQGRFIVLSFPLGKVPQAGEHWSIRHGGLKIGRVKITGPQRDVDTVADIVEGQANVGDEAVPE